ncbi:BREX-1 system adenine-specific DNA-methyltransferase PglX [Peribacillus simplex]|uniref:BREX-1 system adenine-specific DNA-methyltransferase PglX n=1 Tax=Peribacillus simplex TaxID=1478 RepID=UPI000BA51941|nr:BREX-1 system adenine-specific DNA-methyltransferase PglX [Peribacillus simplex]PAK40593.1 SAM-dependent methyltransferase [Peribacillus simplex]
MNKSALKTLAIGARKELLKKVEAKAMKIGITEYKIKEADIESSDAIFIDGKQLLKEEKIQRDKLIARINQIGFNQVMEEVAYTWFNRFTALRYMEVNDYLPTNVRVLSSSNAYSAEPDMINDALSLELEIDKEYVYDLKLNNKTEELFKYLIIKHCNDLNRYLPFMFETIEDYTEILFPDGLLSKDSFISQMTDTEEIPEDNWQRVEIIGWLYQFYITEEKDRVMSAKKKYKTEEIPYATQLFTPHWIVRYMVQNSLGRYWLESHPEHKELLEDWEYYLEYSIPNERKLAPYINKELKVEDIKCFDPAMGSGHILVYMFDVLFEIYSKCGYLEREIPRLIIEKNLFGLDIDDRANQLACFSVVMKALQYNSRFLRSIEREGLLLNLTSMQDSNNLGDQEIAFISGEISGNDFDRTKNFVGKFKEAKTLGSLIKIGSYDKDFLVRRLEYIRQNPAKDLFEEQVRRNVLSLLPKLLKQAEIMYGQYDAVVTNPPYMGNRYMNEDLSLFLQKEYPDSKLDTFASFMEIDHYLKPHAFLSMINQHSWMFISSFEKLRTKIINNKTICSMLHLGSRAFEDIGGEVVQTTSFVLRNGYMPDIDGVYIRLVDFKGSIEKQFKTIDAVKNPMDYRFNYSNEKFNLIKGSPIAYWISDRVREIFDKADSVRDIAKPRVGQNTGDNNRFLRQWFEIDYKKIGFNYKNREDARISQHKWFPYNKGGKYRKWYGNLDYVINWEEDGKEIKEYAVVRNKGKHWSRYIQNLDYIFKEGLTWSDISTSSFGVRYLKSGFIFDVSGSMAFPSRENTYYLTAFLCSKIAYEFLKVLNPTMHFQTGNIANLPIIITDDIVVKSKINELSRMNIDICKLDWDSYEVSWDFKNHPLLLNKKGIKMIKDSLNLWNESVQKRYNQLKENEEELNRIFIDIYGLQEELNSDVNEENVIIRRKDPETDIKSFISYAVGCMFGRYSLDKESLVYAGGELLGDNYGTFNVDRDNIVPVLPGAYFEDDIVSRLINFVQVTFGEETLAENLEFIADTLGKKKGETAKETIRRYFLNEFFKDHVQTYKKRPIYWLFTSGKQKAFNCLIYMHRYDRTTLSRIRTDYLHEYQIRLDGERKSLLNIIEGDSTTKEISNAKKELKTLDKKIEELKEYDELLHHMADMQIEIDLDDGVVVNYEKFKGLVAKI